MTEQPRNSSFLWFGFVWITKTIFVTAPIIGFGFLLYGLTKLDEPPSVSLTAMNTWVAIIGLTLVVTFLFFTFRILIRLLHDPPGSWTLFGSTPEVRIVSLGIVSLIFPKAVYSLITAPLNVLIQFFSSLPQVLLRSITPDSPGTSTLATLDQAILRLTSLLQSMGYELGRGFYRLFELIPVSEVVSMIATWVFLGQMLSTGGHELRTDDPTSRRIRLFGYFQNLSEHQRHSLLLATVFAMGAYLSIAAIVAIPWLQEDKLPQNLTLENLQHILRGGIQKQENFDKDFPANLGETEDPLNPLVKALELIHPDPKDGLRPEGSFDLKVVRLAVEESRANRKAGLELWKQFRDNVRQKQDKIVSDALTTFETEILSPMSTQERVLFFRDIQRAVLSNLSEMQMALQDCMRSVTGTDEQLAFATKNLISLLPQEASVPNKTQNPYRFERLENQVVVLGSISSNYKRVCVATPAGQHQYVIPEPGTGWGPFGFVARWLLRTKSFPLALITGMLPNFPKKL